LEEEVQFILDTAGTYLQKRPTRQDVLSVFAGIRPLVKTQGTGSTAALSRDHTIHIARSGLLTITGGKWTTYRNMAEDAVNHAATLARLDDKPCMTRKLRIHGYHTQAGSFGELAVYGSDAQGIEQLMRDDSALALPLHNQLPIVPAQIIWAVRHEMARTVDDVLARRTRALQLNARAAIDMAPAVAQWLMHELNRDTAWADQQVAAFQQLAKQYLA